MAAPSTGFEMDGTKTTNAHETAFLQTLADETDVTLSVAGYSVDGNTIHRVDLGAGPDVFMVTTLIHASEWAAREGVLAWIRDLAYSTDPAVADYLTRCKIVVVTPCNPDTVGRFNRNGVNINRDHYQQTQPETQAIAAAVQSAGPSLLLDAHETAGANETRNWLGIRQITNAFHPDLIALSKDVHDTIGETLATEESITWGAYLPQFHPRQAMSEVAGAMHVPAVTSETNMNDPLAVRVHLNVRALEIAREWHSQHHVACAAARAVSISSGGNPSGNYLLQSGTYFGGAAYGEVDLAPAPTGYLLDGPAPTAQFAAFGITADGDTVSMEQPARVAIPIILDSESDDSLVESTRIAAGGKAHSGTPIDFRVCRGALTMRPLAVKMRVDGRTHTVWTAD